MIFFKTLLKMDTRREVAINKMMENTWKEDMNNLSRKLNILDEHNRLMKTCGMVSFKEYSKGFYNLDMMKCLKDFFYEQKLNELNKEKNRKEYEKLVIEGKDKGYDFNGVGMDLSYLGCRNFL